MSTLQKITVSTNYWRVPSAEHAMDGQIEGIASEKDINLAQAKALKARAAWKPTAKAMQLVEQLKAFIGSRVQIQFWDSCMFMCDELGPCPLEGDCKDVVVLQHGDFHQAFMVLDNVREIPSPEGCSSLSYLVTVDGVAGQLAPLADLYEVWPVNPDGSVSDEQQLQQDRAVESYNARMRSTRKMFRGGLSKVALDTLYPLWPKQPKKK